MYNGIPSKTGLTACSNICLLRAKVNSLDFKNFMHSEIKMLIPMELQYMD